MSTYLNKPAAFGCKLVQTCVTFQLTICTNGLIKCIRNTHWYVLASTKLRFFPFNVFQVPQLLLHFQYCVSTILINIIINTLMETQFKKKQKKQLILNVEWPYIHIYEFDNAIPFKHQSITCIKMAWSMFLGPIDWRELHLSHIWTTNQPFSYRV